MLNVIEHKGIKGYIEYVPHASEFQVKTISLTKNIYAFGKSAAELEANFARECDNYIDECKANNISVFKTNYGSINIINISPELHEMAVMECALKQITMDELAETALKKYFKLAY